MVTIVCGMNYTMRICKKYHLIPQKYNENNDK